MADIVHCDSLGRGKEYLDALIILIVLFLGTSNEQRILPFAEMIFRSILCSSKVPKNKTINLANADYSITCNKVGSLFEVCFHAFKYNFFMKFKLQVGCLKHRVYEASMIAQHGGNIVDMEEDDYADGMMSVFYY